MSLLEKKDLFDLITIALKEHEKKFDEILEGVEKAFKVFRFCDWCYIHKKNHMRYEACGMLYTTGICPQAQFETIFKLERRFEKR